MLDTKVLAAVLASLAVLGSTTAGGSADPLSLDKIGSQSIGSFDLSPRSLGAFTGLVERPEPDTAIEASLNVNGSLPQDLETQSATVRLEDARELKSGGRTITSDEPIEIHGFSGTLTVDSPYRIKGRSSSVVTSGVNVSESFKVDRKMNSSRITLSDVRRAEVTFDSVEGRVESEATSATIGEGSELVIDSFTGTITIDTDAQTVDMSGEVANMEAGPVSLG